MSDWEFKVEGVARSLGVFSVKVTRITNNIIIPPLFEGQVAEVFKWGMSYKEYEINGRFIGSESEINTFIALMERTEYDPAYVQTQRPACTIKPRWASTPVNCFTTGFDYNDTQGTPGYVDYTLTVVEGTPFVV